MPAHAITRRLLITHLYAPDAHPNAGSGVPRNVRLIYAFSQILYRGVIAAITVPAQITKYCSVPATTSLQTLFDFAHTSHPSARPPSDELLPLNERLLSAATTVLGEVSHHQHPTPRGVPIV